MALGEEDAAVMLADLVALGAGVVVKHGVGLAEVQADGVKDAADELLLAGGSPTGIVDGAEVVVIPSSALPLATIGQVVTVDGESRKVAGRYRLRDGALSALYLEH